ncbi:Transposase IS116/IS110/IS902 family [Legionella busanensis]|uniref:Transposase IS116/IS110/IS902 family n=1 Tax=Legionella busanensis TaxID=190655 RepID=A0A378KDX6_9GAMM|nr:Transposase IS116/IS110/IS902 family [Legionella busanensis]
MAAWLRLVPRQLSSGNKQVLLSISKRGDRYLSTLLIHGARAALYKLLPMKMAPLNSIKFLVLIVQTQNRSGILQLNFFNRTNFCVIAQLTEHKAILQIVLFLKPEILTRIGSILLTF